jgi:hypothetical protein
MVGLVIGGLVGTVVGGILALNLIIFAGTDRGYEAGIGELLAERPLVAAIALAILAVSPIVGIVLAKNRGSPRRDRTDHHRQAS